MYQLRPRLKMLCRWPVFIMLLTDQPADDGPVFYDGSRCCLMGLLTTVYALPFLCQVFHATGRNNRIRLPGEDQAPLSKPRWSSVCGLQTSSKSEPKCSADVLKHVVQFKANCETRCLASTDSSEGSTSCKKPFPSAQLSSQACQPEVVPAGCPVRDS